uniref:PDEase domain-containing protein n=1 Tax=Megaselia scalaris TaxID=36166 RepID=T1GJZ6_MEGSC
MFKDLDFMERFHIDYEMLSVTKNYRNVKYHNWRHAFNVAPMFSILTTTQCWRVFEDIKCLALIIGCLCHDLDHRGTNNSFQIKASSPLVQLYSTSTMEHHHFDQYLMDCLHYNTKEIEKREADLVSLEFFEQGDMEKQGLKILPIDIINREKEDQLPMM